ncbi:hypothetical protein CSB45_03385 [candidate division KSB3 bacterium]|uniref:Protein BatD n=1 Tax=candidate division KSB3 bacterium TaxID=2044937 RepID=A0A2G6E941_9BACT|nr:MAG: hypothetical protein CSB45_03385 [candidate division KSB3 bacterium]PIE29538.1 MAG: hypothetical protein CSA57_07980 [candidate division KSB3 bacterium]
MFSVKRIIESVAIGVLLLAAQAQGASAESPPADQNVTILESRFSTTTPVVGDSFQYSLKFDYRKGLRVDPEEHFDEQNVTILERRERDAQEFEGRIIEQYEYRLKASTPGQFQFSPVSINYSGPRVNSTAAVADPVQLSVSAVLELRVLTNSPLMLGEALELSLEVIKRKPVMISAMPQELKAAVPKLKPFELLEQQALKKAESEDPGNTPTPAPEPLLFTLDQSQEIASQQVDGGTIEHYRYHPSTQAVQAGEYVIPSFTVSYRTASGEDIEQRVEETKIFVLNPSSANQEIATDYRFFTGPAIVAVAVLIGGLFVFFFVKYRQARRSEEDYVPAPLPPGEIAHRELTELQAMNLPAKGEFKQYYFLLSDSVRKFLGAEYRFHVLERTTEEILHDIRQQDIPEPIAARISSFLPESDMVKFAKYIPKLEQADDAMQQAWKIVDESLAYHNLSEETPRVSDRDPSEGAAEEAQGTHEGSS